MDVMGANVVITMLTMFYMAQCIGPSSSWARPSASPDSQAPLMSISYRMSVRSSRSIS